MNKHPNQARITALLPMKANSTRVKGKNFQELSGNALQMGARHTIRR